MMTSKKENNWFLAKLVPERKKESLRGLAKLEACALSTCN